jgi:hypothetical protein
MENPLNFGYQLDRGADVLHHAIGDPPPSNADRRTEASRSRSLCRGVLLLWWRGGGVLALNHRDDNLVLDPTGPRTVRVCPSNFVRRRGATLLHNVGQLMCKQPVAILRPGGVLSRVDDNIGTMGVCARIERPSGCRRIRVGEDPDLAEVVTEARLHEGARL